MENLNQKVKQAVILSLKFPEKDELQFLEKQPATKALVKEANSKLVEVMNIVSKFVTGKTLVANDSLTVSFQSIESVMDDLVEKIGISLDKREFDNDENDGFQEVQQRVKKLKKQAEIQSQQMIKPPDAYGFREQIKFNLGQYPFIPIIKEKLIGQEALSSSIISAQQDQQGFFSKLESQGYSLDGYEFPHPYQQEIENLEYPENMIDPNEQIKSFSPLGQAIMVQDIQTLKQMVNGILDLVNLNGTTEIAIDLEHHNQHSYLGLTCLIQLTTRNQVDYIIDPFPLWKQLGKELSVIFHNEKILKVLHGAESDVLWLQRDFGLYLVNMFDTFNACKSLMFPACSLAYLLDYYCKKQTDKKYQLADWSIRPISSEMLKYAQMDTHYLLYIYDRLIIDQYNLGIERNMKPTSSFIISSFRKSKDTSLKVYKKPLQNSNLLLDGILYRAQKTMDPQRYKLTTLLLELREKLGRENDESTNTILPNYQLFKIIDIKPTNLNEIYSATGGERSTHQLIKKNFNLISQIFLGKIFEERGENQFIQDSIGPSLPTSQQIIEEERKQKIEQPAVQFEQIVQAQYEFESMEVILKAYHGKQVEVRSDMKCFTSLEYTKIKSQFNFEDSFQYFSNSEVVQHILSRLQNNDHEKNQLQQFKLDQQKQQIINQTQTDEYIAFPIIKGEKYFKLFLIQLLSNRPQIKQTQYKLFESTEPQSLQQQYGVKINKRRKYKIEEENVIQKSIQKNGSKNIFKNLT